MHVGTGEDMCTDVTVMGMSVVIGADEANHMSKTVCSQVYLDTCVDMCINVYT